MMNLASAAELYKGGPEGLDEVWGALCLPLTPPCLTVLRTGRKRVDCGTVP